MNRATLFGDDIETVNIEPSPTGALIQFYTMPRRFDAQVNVRGCLQLAHKLLGSIEGNGIMDADIHKAMYLIERWL